MKGIFLFLLIIVFICFISPMSAPDRGRTIYTLELLTYCFPFNLLALPGRRWFLIIEEKSYSGDQTVSACINQRIQN